MQDWTFLIKKLSASQPRRVGGRRKGERAMAKVDCYECKWRGVLPGDEHSCCNHPSLKEVTDNPMLQLIGIFASVGRLTPLVVSSSTLNIKGDPHGISHGWFNFPFNFDPLWLENCDGFETKS